MTHDVSLAAESSPARRLKWWLLLVAAFVLPWALAIGSHFALDAGWPGRIETRHWRFFASAGFIVGGVGAVVALHHMRITLPVRVLLSVLSLVVAAWFALMFQLRSRCGDEPQFVGHAQGREITTCVR